MDQRIKFNDDSLIKRNRRIGVFPFTLALVLLNSLYAHVLLDYPNGGESFNSGETVTIEWHSLIMHIQEDWDLSFSPDGGVSWQPIQNNLPVSQNSYQWIVPEISTNNAKIRIIQDNSGTDYESISADFSITITVLEVEENTEVPDKFHLYSNFPNPFNPLTTIRYKLFKPSQVSVIIYDLLGKEIIQLEDGIKDVGEHLINWDGLSSSGNFVGAGTYLYQVSAGQFTQTRKMVLLK
jgi:hypothetical protein